MKRCCNFSRLLSAGAVALLTGIAGGQAYAQTTAMDHDAAAVPCQSFQRLGNGGWTAIAPVTLTIDNGMSLNFTPGESMAPGSTISGVAVPIILDRHCGNM
jgi:hypothetical protein